MIKLWIGVNTLQWIRNILASKDLSPLYESPTILLKICCKTDKKVMKVISLIYVKYRLSTIIYLRTKLSKNQCCGSGSGMNIPDPQHCKKQKRNYNRLHFMTSYNF